MVPSMKKRCRGRPRCMGGLFEFLNCDLCDLCDGL